MDDRVSDSFDFVLAAWRVVVDAQLLTYHLTLLSDIQLLRGADERKIFWFHFLGVGLVRMRWTWTL